MIEDEMHGAQLKIMPCAALMWRKTTMNY